VKLAELQFRVWFSSE